ncbi:transglutaminase domain-containing protein [Flagellimonas algicola]|uniref:Transglutaminase-like domain-containing protein n=1 Tax=Flagellimonas algicola TaxID=2583815 RepID=A0ABY2WR17_9FLAO|nr:transglutaminase domain-containing protein [Allomuricauda algicola]TMU57435.1 hypothetical protein FGG15_07795 [Allomuricauda algicola]
MDKIVLEYPHFDSIDELAYQIKTDFVYDIDKIRAAFVWVTNNITYGKTMDELFVPRTKIIYYSERGKERLLEKVWKKKVKQAFKNRRGVCFDYSMMLKQLYDLLGIESKLIPGIAKEEIKDLNGETVYKNHSWNAVKLNNKWKLMDPTWAAGFVDEVKQVFVRRFNDHYFDTDPKAFIKEHFPEKKRWQLLKQPITLNSFFSAPIFLPAYFENEVELSPLTDGLIKQTENLELEFAFEKLPTRNRLKYSIHSSQERRKIRNLDIRKLGENLFISTLRLDKELLNGQQLILYLGKRPIIAFRVDQ